jgi:serine/threonine protein kinase
VAARPWFLNHKDAIVMLEIGSLIFGKYHINNFLSRSAAGSLAIARDISLDHERLILASPFADELDKGAFQTKSEAIQGLSHPNLVPVIEILTNFKSGVYVFYAQDGGEDLQKVLYRTGALFYSEVVPILLNIADAISYLHNRSPFIIHGDVQPANIFLTANQGVWLLYPWINSTWTVDSQLSDKKMDIIQLARVGLTLLTHQQEMLTLPQVDVVRIIHEQTNPAIPSSIADALLQAIDSNPARGFSTAEDFKTALLVGLIQIPPETLRVVPKTLTAPEAAAEIPAQETIPPALKPEPTTPIRRRVPWGLI